MSTRRERRERHHRRVAFSLCPNCGKPGPHFVPPCFGDPGFFVCEAIAKIEAARALGEDGNQK